MAIFSALPRDTLSALLAQSELLALPRRTLLFEQDQKALAFYLVLEGWVQLFRWTSGGDAAVVNVFTRGECVGDVPCLARESFPVNAETVSEARLVKVPAQGIIEIARSNPEMGLVMLASLLRQLRMLVDQIEELKACTGPQRLASFLVTLAPTASGACTIALPYEKLIIAARLGMKPESLSRAFQRLQRVGVRTHQNTVAVSDVARLAEFAGRERVQAMNCPLLRNGCLPG